MSEAWGIVGQDRPIRLLADAVASDRVPHSLLLTGPRQVGKRTLGLALARALNCESDSPPCGACRACRLISSDTFPDVRLVQLQEGRQRIGIKDIQSIQADLARRPTEGRRRVVLISRAERLSNEAENALLKTLEEPPPHAVIILTAEEAAALLPTTVSRCRQIRLRPVPAAKISTLLIERHGLEPERAELLATLAEGRVGWAIAAASERGRYEAYEASLARHSRVIEGDPLTRLEVSRELAERWSGHAEEIREELRVWCTCWRDLLRRRLGVESGSIAQPLGERVARLEPATMRKALLTLVQARADLDQNVNPRLALDVALLKLPTAQGA